MGGAGRVGVGVGAGGQRTCAGSPLLSMRSCLANTCVQHATNPKPVTCLQHAVKGGGGR